LNSKKSPFEGGRLSESEIRGMFDPTGFAGHLPEGGIILGD